jgi:hypothetical protein
VRVGGVFGEITEKTGLGDSGFSGQDKEPH